MTDTRTPQPGDELLKRLDDVANKEVVAPGYVTRLVIETLTNDYQEAARVIRQLQAERDAAQEELKRSKREADMAALRIEGLEKKLDAAEARGWDWQPIETAPKDGTKVLLADADGCVAVGGWLERWYEREEFVRHAKDGDVYKTVRTDDGYFDCEAVNPTHWLPIRALKKEKANG